MPAWALTACAVLPGVLLLLATVQGRPGVTWDGFAYSSAATSVVHLGTFAVQLSTFPNDQVDASGHLIPLHPLVLWPPGYPLLIALAMRLGGTGAVAAAGVVNAAALGVLLLCIHRMVTTMAGVRTAFAVTLMMGVAPPVQALFRMVVSEAPFVAVSALVLLALVRWLDGPPHRLYASWLAAVAIGAAIHVRYTGVFLVGVHAAAAAWLLWRDHDVRRRWVGTLASVLAGPLLGSLFLWHRLATLGCAFCEARPESAESLLKNLGDLVLAVAKSIPLFFELVPGPLDTAISLLLFAVAFVLCARQRPVPFTRAGVTVVALSMALSAIYAAGLVVVRTFVSFNPLDTRLAAPAAVPLVMTGLTLVFRVVEERWRRRIAVGASIAFAAGAAIAVRSPDWRLLTGDQLRQSPHMEYVDAHLRDHPGDLIFSPEAARILGQRGFGLPVYWLPRHGVPVLRPGEHGIMLMWLGSWEATEERLAELDRAAARVATGPDFVAWTLAESGTPGGVASPRP